jgi:hypothetical protein
VQIVEPLIAIVASMEVNFITVDSRRVIVPTCRLLTKGFWFTPANKIVEVQHIEVIEGLLAIPTSKDVQIV